MRKRNDSGKLIVRGFVIAARRRFLSPMSAITSGSTAKRSESILNGSSPGKSCPAEITQIVCDSTIPVGAHGLRPYKIGHYTSALNESASPFAYDTRFGATRIMRSASYVKNG